MGARKRRFICGCVLFSIGSFGCSSAARRYGSASGGGGAGGDGEAVAGSNSGGGVHQGGSGAGVAGHSDGSAGTRTDSAGAAGEGNSGSAGEGDNAGAGDTGAGGTSTGGSAGGTADPAPTVTAVSPTNQSAGASPSAVITVTFSKALNAATVTASSVTVTDDRGVVVGGTLATNQAVVTFTPSTRLDLLAKYTVAVTTAVKDAAGDALKQAFGSSFTVRDGAWGQQKTIASATSSSGPVQLATDGKTHAIATWLRVNAVSPHYDVVSAIYTEGVGWGSPILLETCNQNCSFSSAMNGAGDAIVAWLQFNPSTSQTHVDARIYRHGAWGALSSNLDKQAELGTGLVATGIADNGDAHVGWWSYVNTAFIVYSLRADPTGVWDSAPGTPLVVQATQPESLAYAFAANGDGFAVGGGNDDLVVGGRFLESTKQWSPGVIVQSGAGSSFPSPLICLDATGNPTAIWSGGNGLETASYNRLWGAPMTISKGTGYIGSTALAPTPKGALAAWSQSTGAVDNITVNQLVSGTWGSAVVLSNGDYSGEGPSVAADRHGNALLLWTQSSSSVVDLSFARLSAATQAWSAPAALETLAPSVGYGESVVTLADGSSLAVWEMQTSTTDPYFNVFQ